MRPGRYFAEDHPVALHEKFHAEKAPSAQCVGNPAGDLFGLLPYGGRHRLRLPRLSVVAVLLIVPDRLEKRSSPAMAHRQQRNLVIELYESLDDHFPGSRPAAPLRIAPTAIDILFAADDALPVSGRTHDRLDHARKADLADSLRELFAGRRETIRRSRQPQGLGGKPANPLPVHRQHRGPRGGHHAVAFLFQFEQHVGRNGFDLRNDIIRLLSLDDLPQPGPVQHRNHVRPVRDLHGRRVRIAIKRHDFHPVTLQFDGNLFAQFSRPAKQRFFTDRRQRRSNTYHVIPFWEQR